jgi:hypothetical protein
MPKFSLWSLSFRFSYQNFACYKPCPSHPYSFDNTNHIWEEQELKTASELWRWCSGWLFRTLLMCLCRLRQASPIVISISNGTPTKSRRHLSRHYCAVLPALHTLQYGVGAEVCVSILQLCTHSLPDCRPTGFIALGVTCVLWKAQTVGTYRKHGGTSQPKFSSQYSPMSVVQRDGMCYYFEDWCVLSEHLSWTALTVLTVSLHVPFGVWAPPLWTRSTMPFHAL